MPAVEAPAHESEEVEKQQEEKAGGGGEEVQEGGKGVDGHTNQPPALPWGVVPDASTKEQTRKRGREEEDGLGAEEEGRGAPPGVININDGNKWTESESVNTGDRVEVVWEIDGEPSWWQGTLQRTEDVSEACGKKRIWTILYDQVERAGEVWPPSTHRVVFLSSTVLKDLGEGCELDWKLEGSPEIVTAQDIVEEMEEQDRAEGFDPIVAEREELRNMPAEMAAKVATGFRTFADGILSKLAQLRDEKGVGAEVSGEDMHRMLAQVKEETK